MSSSLVSASVSCLMLVSRPRPRPDHRRRPRTLLFGHNKYAASVESTWTTAQRVPSQYLEAVNDNGAAEVAEQVMMKKALGGNANTARCLWWGAAKSFCPAADPLPGSAERPKFNQLETVTTFTYSTDPDWWRSMHAISSYHGNRPTNKQTQTDRTDNNILRR